jgi:hypothetical protein
MGQKVRQWSKQEEEEEEEEEEEKRLLYIFIRIALLNYRISQMNFLYLRNKYVD